MTEIQEFKEAIQTHVFVRAQSGKPKILSKEGTQFPWIFDFRALMLQSKWLERYADIFWDKYGDQYPFQVGGMETVGIMLVGAIVMKGAQRGTPVNGFFIRKTRKREGLMKALEGTLTEEPIVLVDDIINSGGTLIRQVQVLAQHNRKAQAFFAILALSEKSAYAAASAHIAVETLFTLEDFGEPLLKRHLPQPLATFSQEWRFGGADPSFHLVCPKSTPILDGERVYFGADDGTFRALFQDTGVLSWSFRVTKTTNGTGIVSSPAIAKDGIFFGAYDGNVYALDIQTGEKRWVYEDADWVASSPAIAQKPGLLFIGLEFGLFKKRGGIVALDIHTGRKIWRKIVPELISSSPIYISEHELVVIGSNAGMVYAHDARTGEYRWQFQTGAAIKASFVYSKEHDLVIFGSFDSTIYALNARDGALRWKFQTGASVFSTPCIGGGAVYASSLDKHLYALDLATGEQWWEFNTQGRVFASPAYVEDSVWIGSNTGRLCELDPRSGILRGFFQTTERITTKVAYNEKTRRFFFSTVANELYCLTRTQQQQ